MIKSAQADVALCCGDFNRRRGAVMRAPFTQLYLHAVWATWDRLPLITPDCELRLYGAINDKCRELKAVPLALGGMPDHLHLLVRLPTTISVADLVKGVKGSSSHLVTHEIKPEFFKWQGAYGAFTLSKTDVPRIVEYIRRQNQHHAEATTWGDWERCEIQDTDPDWPGD